MIDGIDGRPCYVGVGKGERMRDHMNAAKGGRCDGTPKSKYFLACVKSGNILKPYKVAENLTISEACKIEIMLISMLGRVDLGTGPLQNASAGGFGVRNVSNTTKKKMAESQRTANLSVETRERRSASQRLRRSYRRSTFKRILQSANSSARHGLKDRPITLAKISA